MGIPRLVLFPLVAYLVGKNDFGLFATALSFTLLVGIHPANGLATGLLRNLTHYQDERRSQLSWTATVMCHKFLVLSLSIALVVLLVIRLVGLVNTVTYLCLTFLSFSLYAENEFMLILTPLRYERRFREHALWFLGCSLCVLALGVAGCYLFGVAGLAFGMMAANFVMFGLAARWHYRGDLHYDPDQATMLRWEWVHLSIAGMLVLAGPHLNRIVLRFYADNESVADLFAATGIAYVFIAPITNCSGLLLSMISGYKSLKDISVRIYKMLFAMIVGGSVSGMLLFGIGAPILLRLLFPGFGGRASDLFGILIWMIPANIIIAVVRPLITKFADVSWIPRVNFIILLVTLVLMFSLIPHWGLEGAAWSISVGSVMAAALRIIVFWIIYKRAAVQSQPYSDNCGGGEY